jgi:hypothetical protein
LSIYLSAGYRANATPYDLVVIFDESAYLLVWKDRRDGETMEAARLARFVEPSNSRVTNDFVELKRTIGASRFCVSRGERCHGTAGGPSC